MFKDVRGLRGGLSGLGPWRRIQARLAPTTKPAPPPLPIAAVASRPLARMESSIDPSRKLSADEEDALDAIETQNGCWAKAIRERERLRCQMIVKHPFFLASGRAGFILAFRTGASVAEATRLLDALADCLSGKPKAKAGGPAMPPDPFGWLVSEPLKNSGAGADEPGDAA